MGQLVNNRVLKLPIYRWRCTTIPAPWGLLTIGALILVLGDALYRVLFVPTVSHTILLTPGERLVLRLFGGLLVTGWWALLLAELGKFFSWLVILGPLGLSMTLYVIAWHLGRLREVRTASPWQYTPAGLTLVGIVTLATYLFFARPFETIVGAEDAGVYFSSGGAIAREHGILLTDPGLATFGDAAADAQAKGAARHLLLPLDPTRYRFATWLRLSGFFLDQQQSDVVTPQFFHLFPTWLAVWALLGGGIGAMVYGAPAFGLLGVVLIFFLGQRLFGSAVGALSSLFLSLNGLQLWFARQSLSEVLLQVLLLGAAYTWVLFVEAHRAQDTRRARGALVLAGMALGSVALTHAQFVFLALPLAILIARLWLGRQWSRVYLWFAVPLFLLRSTYNATPSATSRGYITMSGLTRGVIGSRRLSLSLALSLCLEYLTAHGTIGYPDCTLTEPVCWCADWPSSSSALGQPISILFGPAYLAHRLWKAISVRRFRKAPQLALSRWAGIFRHLALRLQSWA